jgi:hypothetical protein
MATAEEFNAALVERIAPATVFGVRGDHTGLKYKLTDGRELLVKRQRIKEATAEQLRAYVNELVS